MFSKYLIILLVSKCLGMDDEVRIRVPEANQFPSREISFVNNETEARQLQIRCPIHSMHDLNDQISVATQTDQEVEYRGHDGTGVIRRPIAIPPRRNFNFVNREEDIMAVPNEHMGYNGQQNYNLRSQLPMERWMCYITLDLDNLIVPNGVGMKRYGDRLMIFTVKNPAYAQINHISFGNININVPGNSRNCVIWIYTEQDLYHVTVELLHENRWISKIYIENRPRSNIFRQTNVHINDHVNSNVVDLFPNGPITPIDLILPTNLDINDPNWVSGAPSGMTIVDMPGNPMKYYEISGSRVRIDKVKFGDVIVKFLGNHHRLIWVYISNALKHIRIENYSMNTWYGELWIEMVPGINHYRLIDCWTFPI